MSYYNSPRPVDDDATPILIPAAVGLISLALWILVFVFVFPWDKIPAPEVCSQVPIYKGIFGTIDGYRTRCAPSEAYTVATGIAVSLWTIGSTFLAVIFTLRALTKGRRGNV